MASSSRYTLVRKIADGGTGEVFLATMEGSAGFQRLVVLKRVKPDLWADERFRKMLIDEAHISMALHHSNIVQVLDLGSSGQHYFLAFELVDGWTLSQVMARAKKVGHALPLNLALHTMAETSRALAYAHGRVVKGQPLGIVHRDVTPQNVLLSEQGEVKLADFGIAKARSRLTVSQVGQVKGKPAYMSPEQASGQELDARSDLYAMGVMLYWLVSGELPFTATSQLEALAKAARAEHVPIETKRADLPRPLVKLIERALQRDVSKRFQTAEELLAELESIQRKVLEPAGQSELKAWLSALATLDGARPVSRVQETLPPSKTAESIQLVDDSDVDASPHTTRLERPGPQAVGPALGGSGRTLLALALMVILGVGGATAWHAFQRSVSSPPMAAGPTDHRPTLEANALTHRPEATEDEWSGSSSPHESSLLGAGSDAAALASDASLADDLAAVDDSPSADAAVAAVIGGSPADDATPLASDRPLEQEVEVVGVAADGPPADDAGAVAAAPAVPTSPEERRIPEVRPSSVAAQRPPPAPPLKARPPKEPPPRTGPEKQPTKLAKAAEPLPSEMLSVLIESEPKGAEVSIDRRVFGKTPIPLRLRAGITFELVFTKPGYRQQRALYAVTRRPGQKVRVSLSPGR